MLSRDREGAVVKSKAGHHTRAPQELRLIRKFPRRLETRVVNYCRFVPLCGAQAWRVK
ncbi:MAG: hypothetical protein HY238_15580 [Acidobacteria bacterium]|nr:hypothetical protein [Acidobacteriota bacterium]